MPIYEYECNDCRKRQEIIQAFSDPPPAQCPACGGGMKKLFSSPAIQFKGSGFYKTDYASPTSAPGKGEKAEAKGEASESKNESKSDSKSESKGESPGGGSADASPPSKGEKTSGSDTASATKTAG